MRIISQTEVAKQLKCSQGYIGKLAKEGKIKKYKAGKVDLDEVLEYMHGVSSTAPQNVESPSGEKSLMTYAQAKTAREAYSAKKAKLEVEEMEGKLVSVDSVKKDAQNLAVIIKTKLLAIPSKTAPYLVGKDIAEIKQVLDGVINEALDELNRRQY